MAFIALRAPGFVDKSRSLRRIMRVSITSLLVLLCILPSCYKRHTEPREPFTLTGHVTDCRTGLPIEGATVSVEASARPTMGFFGTSTGEGGSALTDAKGHFSIIPYEYSFTERFYLRTSKEGYTSDEITAYKESILASGAKNYQVDSLCIRH